MERPKLDWKTFTARRRMDIGPWIQSKGFSQYSDLKTWFANRNMEPPKLDEVKEFFAKKAVKAKKIKEEILDTIKEEMMVVAPPLVEKIKEKVEKVIMEEDEEGRPKRPRKKKLDEIEE
jgi:hypothetical protein